MRQAEIERNTFETKIKLSLNLDAQEPVSIDTGVGFFDHMLTLFARHSRMSLVVKADGDLHVDSHHTVEDVGIVLGQALKEALGDKSGINRYGTSFVPMDETLGMASLDLSGRSYLVFDCEFDNPKLGNFDTDHMLWYSGYHPTDRGDWRNWYWLHQVLLLLRSSSPRNDPRCLQHSPQSVWLHHLRNTSAEYAVPDLTSWYRRFSVRRAEHRTP